MTSNNKMEIIGCGAYWPPNPSADLMHHFQDTLDVIDFQENSLILIAGDLNAHHVSFPYSSHTNASGASLNSLMIENDLHQIVTEPTRITEHSKSILDVILTNIPEMLHFHCVLPGIGSSDHAIAAATIRYELQDQEAPSTPLADKTPCFDCTSTNWQRLNNYYSQVDWSPILQYPNISDAWS
jgi:hypothetical protein